MLRTIAAQATLWLLIGLLGFGDERWYHVALGVTQLPGVILLSEIGWCCGIGGGFVISDVIVNRWGGLTAAGAPVLALTTLCILLVFVVPVTVAAHYLARRSAFPSF